MGRGVVSAVGWYVCPVTRMCEIFPVNGDATYARVARSLTSLDPLLWGPSSARLGATERDESQTPSTSPHRSPAVGAEPRKGDEVRHDRRGVRREARAGAPAVAENQHRRVRVPHAVRARRESAARHHRPHHIDRLPSVLRAPRPARCTLGLAARRPEPQPLPSTERAHRRRFALPLLRRSSITCPAWACPSTPSRLPAATGPN